VLADQTVILTSAQIAVGILAALTVVGGTIRIVVVPWLRDSVVVPQLMGIEDGVRDLTKQVSATNHLVTYHLGTNGTTEPLRDRVLRLEGVVADARDDIADIKQAQRNP
jgi:hypothetical protein